MGNRGLRAAQGVLVLGQSSYQLGALVSDRCPGFGYDLASGTAALVDLVLQLLKASEKLERVGVGQRLINLLRQGRVDEESTLANATGQIPERGDVGLGALKIEPDVGAIAVYECRQFRGEVPLQVVELLAQTLALAGFAHARRSLIADRRPRHLRVTADPARQEVLPKEGEHGPVLELGSEVSARSSEPQLSDAAND